MNKKFILYNNNNNIIIIIIIIIFNLNYLNKIKSKKKINFNYLMDLQI